MNRIITYFIITFFIMTIPVLIFAQENRTAYVSNVLILTVRKGPASHFEVFRTIESGEALILLEEKESFSKVKLANGDIGWVQSQYLTFETPDRIIIARLNKKINKLNTKNKKQLEQIELLNKKKDLTDKKFQKEKNELISNLAKSVDEKKDYIDKYSMINKNYNDLMEKSKKVILIVNENKRFKKINKELSERLEDIEFKNKSLLKVSMIKWFLAGAGVLFLGWVIGRIVSSKGSRRNRLLS